MNCTGKAHQYKCTIKPLDEEMIVRAARECGRVVTCEEHSVVGGLGEAVAMVLSQKCPVPMRYVGVQDVFGRSGPAWTLLDQHGMSAWGIVNAAKSF